MTYYYADFWSRVWGFGGVRFCNINLELSTVRKSANRTEPMKKPKFDAKCSLFFPVLGFFISIILNLEYVRSVSDSETSVQLGFQFGLVQRSFYSPVRLTLEILAHFFILRRFPRLSSDWCVVWLWFFYERKEVIQENVLHILNMVLGCDKHFLYWFEKHGHTKESESWISWKIGVLA